MCDIDPACNLRKESGVVWEGCAEGLVITIPYVSHAVKKCCLHCEMYAANIVVQIKDGKS